MPSTSSAQFYPRMDIPEVNPRNQDQCTHLSLKEPVLFTKRTLGIGAFLTAQAEPPFRHFNEIPACNLDACQKARQQEIEASGLEIDGTGGYTEDWNGTYSGYERHGTGKDRGTVKHIAYTGFDEGLAGHVIRVYRESGCGDDQIGAGTQQALDPSWMAGFSSGTIRASATRLPRFSTLFRIMGMNLSSISPLNTSVPVTRMPTLADRNACTLNSGPSSRTPIAFSKSRRAR